MSGLWVCNVYDWIFGIFWICCYLDLVRFIFFYILLYIFSFGVIKGSFKEWNRIFNSVKVEKIIKVVFKEIVLFCIIGVIIFIVKKIIFFIN